MISRKIHLDDAENFLNLCKKLDTESKFMMLEPNERTTSVEGQTSTIKSILEEDYSTIFVCEIDQKLVGYISATRESFHRVRHSCYIVIGILQKYTGRGIGTKLFAELEKWAQAKQIHRLELTVMCHNEAGIALYRKMGFTIEGVKKDSLIIDHQFVDEYYMAKIFS